MGAHCQLLSVCSGGNNKLAKYAMPKQGDSNDGMVSRAQGQLPFLHWAGDRSTLG